MTAIEYPARQTGRWRRLVWAGGLAAALAVGAAACGKKPDGVLPPEDEPDVFPRTYPSE